MVQPPVEIKHVRQVLGTLTESDLTAFCQDEFVEIALQVSARNTLLDRINLLIDHCLRAQDRYNHLLKALRERGLLQAMVRPGHSAHMLAHPHYFDLEDVIRQCGNRFYQQQEGPLFFGLKQQPKELVKALQTRLRDEHEDALLYDQPLIILSAAKLFGLRQLRSLAGMLETQAVLQSVIVGDQHSLEEVLTLVNNELTRDFHYRLVLIINSLCNSTFPPFVSQLQVGRFTPYDVKKWLHHLAGEFHLPHEILKLWRDVLIKECRDPEVEQETVLDTEAVYNHLDLVMPRIERFHKGEDIALFRDWLNGRARAYA